MPRRNGTGIALLADATRRRIVGMCASQPRRPSAVARLLGVSRSTATRQLHMLADAGLVVRQRSHLDGRGVLYVVDRKKAGAIIAWLAGTKVAWDGSEGDPPIV